jgi:hypothetical protein
MPNKKISQLNTGSTLDGTELVPIVQGGITKKVTAQDIADLGGAVETVTGTNVDNTDPLNPVVLEQTTVGGENIETKNNKGQPDGYVELDSLNRILFPAQANPSVKSIIRNINTTSKNYIFPDNNGTIALTSDIPSSIIASPTTQVAVIDGDYIVNATTTFTDPTPLEGKGYTVFVINGTATVGGITYSTLGTKIERIYHSGSWVNYTNELTNAFIDYVPTYTGVSVAPSGGVNRYCLQDKLCTVYVAPTSNGTSNATTFTLTLPFNAKNLAVVSFGFCVDNGAITGGGYGITTAGSNVLTLAKQASSTWVSSGGKRVVFTIQYEIQ